MQTLRKYDRLTAQSLPVAQSAYMDRVTPFHMVGNTYYVGNRLCSAVLVDTGDGLILLDTPFGFSTYLLIQSIWELGLNPGDIKYILHTHAHNDHFGCTAVFRALYGAKTFIGEIDAEIMENMRKGEKRVFGREEGEEIPAMDVWLRDGDEVTLGDTTVRCVLSPGHTQGAVSYFWQTLEDGKTYTCGLFGGAGFNTLCWDYFEDFGVSETIRDDFEATLNRLALEQVDVHVGNHPMQSDAFGKREQKEAGAKENPFVAPGEWARFLLETKANFQAFRAQDDAEHSSGA